MPEKEFGGRGSKEYENKGKGTSDFPLACNFATH
jgi:hypothetical protein